MPDADRLETLERTTESLADRLARLEARMLVAPAALATPERPRARPAEPPPVDARPPVAARTVAGAAAAWAPVAHATARQATRTLPTATPRQTLEDLVAGRLLAWAGGLTVLAGIVLLFAVAVSRGWIGESARVAMGAAGSFALVAAGAWLHERRGRTDAALAAAAAGIAGLFVTAVVASRVFELVPAAAGMFLALAVGALATTLALRWRSQAVAALGILGGLLAPVLLGAPSDGATIAVLLAAAVSAAAVCSRERWDQLALAAFAVVTPQWVASLAGEPSVAATVATLVAFGLLAVAVAVGLELRERADAVRPASVLLLALNAFVLAASGVAVLDEDAVWLVALAAAHLGLGLALLRARDASRAVAVVALALGAVLVDLALTELLSGLALTVAWSAVALGFAPLLARLGSGIDGRAAGAGLGAHVALAIAHALSVDVPPEAIAGAGAVSLAASGALAVLAATCFASGTVLAGRAGWGAALHALGLAATAALAAANLDGALLVVVWAAEAVVLAELARRSGALLPAAAAAAHLALAVGHALVVEAPPSALLDGLTDAPAALAALTACTLAAWRCALAAADQTARARLRALAGDAGADAPTLRTATIALGALGALLALHLTSTIVVDTAGAGPQAQTLLSALWGATGVAVLVAGLVRDAAALRTGALLLLLAALGKVTVYDLAALTPIARVASFIALGLLLLLGAFAWQRFRPRPLPDLRAAPSAR